MNRYRFSKAATLPPVVDALLAFAAALIALRLAGSLARRWRASGRPELRIWARSLAAYAVAAAAIAWGEASQWDGRAFRVYYAAGALLTAPLLGAGSSRSPGCGAPAPRRSRTAASRSGSRSPFPYTAPSPRRDPPAQDHLGFLPARLLAIVANALGTAAVVVVAIRSFRRRPLGNALIVLGVAAAATGSGLAGLGAGGAAVGIAVGAALLYAGFVAPATISRAFLDTVFTKSPLRNYLKRRRRPIDGPNS